MADYVTLVCQRWADGQLWSWTNRVNKLSVEKHIRFIHESAPGITVTVQGGDDEPPDDGSLYFVEDADDKG